MLVEMQRIRLNLIMGGLMLALMPALAGAAVPLVQAGRGSAPAIDGRLADAAWSSCAQAFPFIQLDGAQLAETQTRAYLFFDDTALYAGFRCDEPDLAGLAASCTTRDDTLWRDDCVEFMLQRPGQEGHYQVIVNTLGATFEAKDTERSWNPQIQAAVFKGEDYWSAEFALPWVDLGGPPAPGEIWRGNFCRERKVKDELSSWSCSHGRFTTPVHFGELVFADEAVRLELLELHPPLPGANAAQIRLVVPQQAALELSVTGVEPMQVPAGRAEPVDVTYPLGFSDKDLVVEARVADRVVWRGAFPTNIQPRPELNNLQDGIESLRVAKDTLPEGSPLSATIETALDNAAEAAAALRAAIDASLEEKRPLDEAEYNRLNRAVAAQTRNLGLLRWPIWTKNNWTNLDRTELPASVESMSLMALTSLVNEYESANFVITNLGTDALRLRVTATDLDWFPKTEPASDNLLANGDFDEDADGNGVPDSWRHVTGARAAWRIEAAPKRGQVLAIDCARAPETLTVRQNLTLEHGKHYTLEFWAKTDQATPHVRVGAINSGWAWSRFSQPLGGTTGWHRARATISPPESPTHQLVIWVSGGGSGTVWLDDLRLTEGGPAAVTFEDTAPLLSVADWQELRGGSVVADPLIPLNPAGRLDVPPGESRQVWATFPARDLPPGHYECSILTKPLATIAHQGSPPAKSVHVQLEMQPLRLPTHADFAVYNWDYARNEAYVRDLAEHKVNFFLLPTGMPLPQFDAEGNALGEMDFSGLDERLRIKARYARAARGQLLFSYGITRDFVRRVQSRHGFEFMDEAWVKAFRHAYTKWLDHLKAFGLGYDEFCVQVWDEAIGPNVDFVVEGGKLLREIDPNVRLVMDGVQTIEEVHRMDPYIDVWIPHLHALENPKTGPALLECYAALGEPVYTYTCSVFMKSLPPYTYHRLKPWQAARLGLDGVFYWDYSSWRGDPWDDFDGPIADCGAVYDGAEGAITSRRWEASREGIEDWQLMRLLERLGQGGQAPRVQGLIDDALETVLTNKDQLDLAETYRLKMIQAGVDLAQTDPLEISDTSETMQDRALAVTFKTNRPATGKLLYRVIGAHVWQTVDFPEATDHAVHVTLPLFARAEWALIAWDAEGRVAATLNREESP